MDVRGAAADSLRELGDLYRDVDPGDAETYYRRSLGLRPDVAGVHARLAVALCRLNRFGEAEEHLARARALDPHHDEAACLFADLMVSNGLVPEALATYRSMISNGASPRLRTEYADLLQTLGLNDDAEGEYRLVLDREETVEARVNLGVLLVERGRPADALAEFDRALRLDPGSVEARLNRANALVELGRLDAAESGFAPLVDDPDTRGAALLGLAAVYDRRGEPQAARRAREAAVTAAPELADGCARLLHAEG